MATVNRLLPSAIDFYAELQEKTDLAEAHRYERYMAAMTMIRITRGWLIRKHMKWLAKNATIIQSTFRVYMARRAFRAMLRRGVRAKHAKHYAKAAITIEALWRGHYSRRTKFCYRTYRRWLATVKERGERRAAEAAEFGIRSRADDLRILEEEARQWLAFVVFKLHHLLRTYVCAGIYSDPASTELSEFEALLKSIHYTEYMKRLKRKYDEFVRKHRPAFSNKRLFPIIGDGADYWYLSLAEMYELTSPVPPKKGDYRHKARHHGKIHKDPFLWRKPRPEGEPKDRGPFTPPISATTSRQLPPPPPAPTPIRSGGDTLKQSPPRDPRFHLYVKHYKPDPEVIDYVNFHINVLVRRKCSVTHIDID